MDALGWFVALSLTFGWVFCCNSSGHNELTQRSFCVDHDNNTFLMDGKKFRYVSGSFHYFRALPEAWPKRLRTMRAAGLNVIDTYVEWSLHNPQDGIYNWQGIADIEHFIELARKEGFYVILRPGPYICAERDNGGFPYWLFGKYPDIKLRTSDVHYLREVARWFSVLMPRLQKYFYGNGGPVIMVQVENEYGAFPACDRSYTHWLRDEMEKYVQGNALLFTTDIPTNDMSCGKIDGVFATTDFGIDERVWDSWMRLRRIQPTGPFVNSEFYSGWLTHWQEENQRRNGSLVAKVLTEIVNSPASVNIYMFFGGTNFGFSAGANDWGSGNYVPDITSYDYDAVMNEAGDTTPKFRLIRDVIATVDDLGKDLPDIPTNVVKLSYGLVQLKAIAPLLSAEACKTLGRTSIGSWPMPPTFEDVGQYSGLLLYETDLPHLEIDPTVLTVYDLRDRAYVLVDQRLVGTLSRMNKIYSLPLNSGMGSKLQILVENQGRINFNNAKDFKGIIGPVTLQKANGSEQTLWNWKTTSFELENVDDFIKIFEQSKEITSEFNERADILTTGPHIFHGEFIVDRIGDTYLNPTGWGKGVAFVNGFNLGRYWPLIGPQITLYVPNELLRIGPNNITLVEYQRFNQGRDTAIGIVSLDAAPQLDGQVLKRSTNSVSIQSNNDEDSN